MATVNLSTEVPNTITTDYSVSTKLAPRIKKRGNQPHYEGIRLHGQDFEIDYTHNNFKIGKFTIYPVNIGVVVIWPTGLVLVKNGEIPPHWMRYQKNLWGCVWAIVRNR